MELVAQHTFDALNALGYGVDIQYTCGLFTGIVYSVDDDIMYSAMVEKSKGLLAYYDGMSAIGGRQHSYQNVASLDELLDLCSVYALEHQKPDPRFISMTSLH